MPSQITALNSRRIAFIPLFNWKQYVKQLGFLKKLFVHARFIFTFLFFDGSAKSPNHIFLLFAVKADWYYLQNFKYMHVIVVTDV